MTTNIRSSGANSNTIVPVYNDNLSNATSNHFFVPQIKKTCLKRPLQVISGDLFLYIVKFIIAAMIKPSYKYL